MAAPALFWLCASLFSLGRLDTPASLSASNSLGARLGRLHPSEVTHSPSRFTHFQREAAAAANHYRTIMGLPLMQLDPALCEAAQAHSRYLAINDRFSHEQETSLPGYTGRMPWDRARLAGYPFGCAEDISSNTNPRGAVDQLMAAPYHRVPFMEPVPIALGVGSGSAGTTLEFDGKPGADGVTVYPADGQTGVPTSWSGREVPNPLRNHDARLPVGYVISYHAFLTNNPQIAFKATRLTKEDGTEVPCFRNTPDDDIHLKSALLLIPKRPLEPGTRYRVTVEAETENGQDISKSWSFRTAAATAPKPGQEYVRLAVRSRPGGMGAWLSVSVFNKSKKRVGPYLLSVVLPNKVEARATIPSIAPGKTLEMGVSVKAAYGQVRLLSAAKKGQKPVQLGAAASFDVRSATARR